MRFRYWKTVRRPVSGCLTGNMSVERTVSKSPGSFFFGLWRAGVARVDGKTVFIGGALPGERVALPFIKKKSSLQ